MADEKTDSNLAKQTQAPAEIAAGATDAPAADAKQAEIASQSAEVTAAPLAADSAPVIETLVQPAPVLEPVVEIKPDVFTCPDCNASFTNRQAIWGHAMGKHGKDRARQIIASFGPAPSKGRNYHKRPASSFTPTAEQPTPETVPSFDDVTGNGSTQQVQPEITTAASAAVNVDYKAMSAALFDMSTGIASNIFGDEWKPRSEEERQSVCIPLEVWMKSKQMPDLPPGFILAIVVCAYSAPRLRAPTTKDKLARFWLWMKSKFPKRKAKLIVMPNRENAA